MAVLRSSLNEMAVGRAAVKVMKARRVVRRAEDSMMGEEMNLKGPREGSSPLWRIQEITFLFFSFFSSLVWDAHFIHDQGPRAQLHND